MRKRGITPHSDWFLAVVVTSRASSRYGAGYAHAKNTTALGLTFTVHLATAAVLLCETSGTECRRWLSGDAHDDRRVEVLVCCTHGFHLLGLFLGHVNRQLAVLHFCVAVPGDLPVEIVQGCSTEALGDTQWHTHARFGSSLRLRRLFRTALKKRRVCLRAITLIISHTLFCGCQRVCGTAFGLYYA